MIGHSVSEFAGGREPMLDLREPVASRFTDLLLSELLVTRRQLDAALERSRQLQGQLADAIVQLGFVTERDAYTTLAAATGLHLVDLSARAPSPLALRLVPARVARRHGLVPLDESNRILTYAVSRPFDDEAERDVTFASGRKPFAVLAPRTAILETLDRCYPGLADVDLLLARIRSTATVEMIDVGDASIPTDSPVIDLCNHLIARAVDSGASDVHIEPSDQGLTVRFRLGGILEPVMTLPAETASAVCNRYKVMARADIAVRQKPQDGAFRLLVNNRAIDVRLSTLPTINGEKLVMRVIDSHAEPTDLGSLGYDPETLERLRRALGRPDGLVLVTGPTGSGKTTSLYSALNELRNGRTNIVSVEDPVERRVEGVNQIQVNGRSGNTFAAVLRSVLRQDPNVIMVGEIRDGEVAQIVGQAAYTGHLVLSSLHTGDSASAITRLFNLGLEPFKVAESLTAILAQRLLRRLCPECARRHDDVEARQLGREHGVESVPASAGPGCDRCRQTAYLERIPVAEILVPDDQTRDAIARGATAAELRVAMHAAGCRSMRDQALALVARGVTSIDEVNRVLAVDSAVAVKHGDRRRVLVVEDDRLTRMLVKLLLEHEGYEVLEGANGRQAVEIALRERPDLLLIDLLMPEMDGYEAIEHIRRNVSLATLPVIVLTAEVGPGVERRVLEIGADDYMLKPFEAPVLISRVAAAFRRMQRLAA
jgi:type IV pilus assembly protein PilB